MLPLAAASNDYRARPRPPLALPTFVPDLWSQLAHPISALVSRTIHAVAQMGDVGPVDDPGLCQLPCLIEAFEEADTISDDEWHDVQLQLIDKPTREALPGNVRPAPDRHIAVGGRLFRRSDCSCNAVGDKDELDHAARYRRGTSWVITKCGTAYGVSPSHRPPLQSRRAPAHHDGAGRATSSAITGWLISDGLKYQS